MIDYFRVYGLVSIISVASVSASPPYPSKCGYQSCPLNKEGNYLNLHIVAHTHDDVGWLKTFDQYYFGSNNSIQNAGVQYILDSVVQELLQDPNKRFIYVETAYFWKWWTQQTNTIKDKVKHLVNNGQLEFIGGAWSMHDEAAAHYHSMLDQTTWGFRKLDDIFGECGWPRVGWQIDPFGHSKENANLMAKYGFDGLFLGRIDWEDKKWRIMNKTMEMIWHTSSNDDTDSSQLFTSVLYNVYAPPKGFCFDDDCNDEPIVDDKTSPLYNAEQKAEEFVRIMLKYSRAYRTSNILITMGEDFFFQNARKNFKNIDKLISGVNRIEVGGLKMNAFYSTPSCYLKAVNNDQIPFPTKSDDFIPYSSDPYSFWTGYYTSRPTSKRFERIGNNFLQVCKQLYSISNLGEDTSHLDALREAMGVMQHHDAITGTEKQHVADDYARILTDAINKCGIVAEKAFNKLMPKNKVPVIMGSCLLSNISSCPLVEDKESFVVTLYNPLSRPVNHLVRFPFTESLNTSFTVFCPLGKEQSVQVMNLPHSIVNLPGRRSKATKQFAFIAKNIPPLGYKSYYVTRNSNEVKNAQKSKEIKLNGQSITLGYNEGVSMKIDGSTGRITHMLVNGRETTLENEFFYYVGAVGNNKEDRNRSSGAYIFRPNGTEKAILNLHDITIFKGDVISEIHQYFDDWITQVIRLRKDVDYAEYEWIVGPIPISDGIGKEIVTRFKIDSIQNNDEFLTDSNGREYIKRKLNHRQTWPVNLSEKVPGNYYPITTTISISDNKSRLSIVTDRAQGGSSLKQGQLELMVHRRLLHDDAFGVGEALNEVAFGEGLVAVGSHFISLGSLSDIRNLVQEKILDVWTFISPTQGIPFSSWQNLYDMEFSALRIPLPENIQILTLEPWKDSSVLLRLEHIMSSTDHPELSNPVTIDLRDVFSFWALTGIEEMMLGANVKMTESKRLTWMEEGGMNYFTYKTIHDDDSLPSPFTITLNPMEIKTYIINVSSK